MDASQIAELELYDVTTKLAIMYKRILEYSELQVSTKCYCLYATNPRNLRTMAE